MCVCERENVCVCVRERLSVCVCEREREYVCVYKSGCVCFNVHRCMRVCTLCVLYRHLSEVSMQTVVSG